MQGGAQRRERLAAARLYFVTDAGIDDEALAAALSGGADMVQLRDRTLGDDDVIAAAERLRAACDAHDALFWLNDRPDLALRTGADGVHVGQHDTAVAEVRAEVGGDMLVGLSTHSPEQLEAAIAAAPDQLSVGPVWATPTKPGRPATGLAYVRFAAERRPPQPWFAIGGIDAGNVAAVIEAGAQRIVVVRALREAADPAAAAAELLGQMEGSVGAAQ